MCLQSSHQPIPSARTELRASEAGNLSCCASSSQLCSVPEGFMDCSSGQVPRPPRAGLHLQPPQNFPWQHPTFSGTASDFSLLVQKLPVLLQEHVKNKATEMPFQSILCQYSVAELNNILTLLALVSILQRCYRRKISKNLPHLTTLHSGYSRNYLAGVKTPVASLNYHFHPRCASF